MHSGLCSIEPNLDFRDKFTKRVLNIKFHRNPSSYSSADTCGRADMTKVMQEALFGTMRRRLNNFSVEHGHVSCSNILPIKEYVINSHAPHKQGGTCHACPWLSCWLSGIKSVITARTHWSGPVWFVLLCNVPVLSSNTTRFQLQGSSGTETFK